MAQEYNPKEIEQKWQTEWEKSRIFESNPKPGIKKFFVNFPYPYVNAFSHLGHLYTLSRVDTFARYKRLQGYNILFPQGWHATGSPIVNAAQRVKEREAKQVKIMKDMGFTEDDLLKFENPEYWIKFFVPEFENDYKTAGVMIDWRRTFYTTSLNPHYNKFIEWQFTVLKEKGFVKKGKFPVVWCDKDNCAVGDHNRTEGEGETPQEFTILKFKTEKENEFIICATLRPETVFGQTNLWIGPENEYVKAKVNNQIWIISEPATKKLEQQERTVQILEKIKGKDLIGKYVTAPMIDRKIPILPANFCNVEKGTGIVTSVPSDAPDDWMGLHDLQNNEAMCKKYNLNFNEIKNIKPIAIIDSNDLGDMAAVKICQDLNIKSQNERSKLEEAKKIVYKKGFYEGVMNKNCQEFSDMKVEQAKDKVKNKLIKNGQAELLYELTGKVVCRCLTPSVVRIVADQWFLDYGNDDWKKLAHECLDDMNLYPEKSRQQFNYVIDWLHEWACTREEGLGTRLPWDQKWVIESLSDSTIYMAYYTIVHKIKNIDVKNINNDLFDYIFLDKPFSKNIKIEKELCDEMKKEFEYWYPFEFRNSGKDLVQNHLTFSIFNHVAIFPKKYWPKGIGVNGHLMVDGQKMSKSLGNFILFRQAIIQYGADASRITLLNGGEGLDDNNWDSSFAKLIMQKIDNLFTLLEENCKKGCTDNRLIDKWAESEINRIIKETTSNYEVTNFRTAIQKSFFEISNIVKWYLTRTNNNPNKTIFAQITENIIIMLSPIVPHICEEYWHKIGKHDFVCDAHWPKFDEKLIDEKLNASEQIVENTIYDINNVKKLVKIEKPSKITIILSKSWKYDYYRELNSVLKETRDVKEIMKTVLANENFKKHSDEIIKNLPKMVGSNKIPETKLTLKEEENLFAESLDYFKKTYGCEIAIVLGDRFENPKSNNSQPGKPAIILE